MDEFTTIVGIRSLLKERRASAVEVVQECLRRIRALDSRLNCFVAVQERSALEAARLADIDLSEGKERPLTGIPIGHKENFCIEDVKTTCCSRMLDSFVSPYTATIVNNLRNSGAIWVGKTNMDEFAMGSSNETSAFGPVRNPWDLDRVPGGSSGGSATAVAARLVPACTGSDTGGSLRQPASYCGVTGFKPTYGANSRFGMVAFASSLDHPGSITHTVADAAEMFAAMSGHDHQDSTSVRPQSEPFPAQGDRFKIGYPTRLFRDLPTPVSERLDEARRTLEQAGHLVFEIDIPHFDVAAAAYYVISCAEASTNLSRYDGVRFGHRSSSVRNLDDDYARTRSEGFGSEVKRRILTGTYVLSVGHFDEYYVQAQKIRRLIRDDFIRAFEIVDLILSPTAPRTAFKHHEMDESPTEMYKQDQFTVPANLAGLPSMSIPCGLSDALPIGLQLIAPHFREASLFALGAEYQSLTDWHEQPPPVLQ